MSNPIVRLPATTISERRLQHPFHERLIVHNTESMQKILESKYYSTEYENENIQESSTIPRKNQEFLVNGINILNKNDVDSNTAMYRIMQRRKTHNRVERRRRDRMNNLFSELKSALPSFQRNNINSNKPDILQEAISYVKLLQLENNRLRGGVRQTLRSFDDDDLSSLSSFISSNYCNNDSISSSPSYTAPILTSSTFERPLIPLVHENKRLAPSFRSHNRYESVIIFN